MGEKAIAEAMPLQINPYDQKPVTESQVLKSGLLPKGLPQSTQWREAGDDLFSEPPAKIGGHVLKAGRGHPEKLQR